MIYICPTCKKEFSTEAIVVKHYLSCWKEKNPHCKSTPAPKSENLIREVEEGVLDFFKRFQ